MQVSVNVPPLPVHPDDVPEVHRLIAELAEKRRAEEARKAPLTMLAGGRENGRGSVREHRDFPPESGSPFHRIWWKLSGHLLTWCCDLHARSRVSGGSPNGARSGAAA